MRRDFAYGFLRLERDLRMRPIRRCGMVFLALWAGAMAVRAEAPPAPAPGSSADGKVFRILDRITREVDKLVLFQGKIPQAIAVGRSTSGASTLCMNCLEEKASPKGEGKPEGPARVDASPKTSQTAPQTSQTAPPGDLLVCDLERMFNLRFSEGAFFFYNEDGYDADGRDYVAFPIAGTNTSTCRVSNLFFVSSPSADRTAPSGGSCPFQVAIRRLGETFVAPVGGCDRAPAKVKGEDTPTGSPRDLTRSRFQRVPDWGENGRTGFVYREGAASNALLESIALLAGGPREFLVVLDLRKLESAQSSYFWARERPTRSVRLDKNTVTVEGSPEGQEGGYEPATFVEYPYLILLGEYAKVRLTPTGGGAETVLVLGFCDECP